MFPTFDAITFVVLPLIASTIAVKSSPFVNVIVSPLITNGLVAVITGEETVPVTSKSATAFVTPSIVTVLPVVNREFSVALDVNDILCEPL